jgi:hypothetical protein
MAFARIGWEVIDFARKPLGCFGSVANAGSPPLQIKPGGLRPPTEQGPAPQPIQW